MPCKLNMALGATFFYYYPVMVCPIPKQYMELHILQSTKENHQLMLVHISVKKYIIHCKNCDIFLYREWCRSLVIT